MSSPNQNNAALADSAWTVEGAILKLIGEPLEELSSSPVPYFHLLERLKTTKREGWVRRGIPSAESIADHQYRMAMICMLAPTSLSLNHALCMKMALIHDLAESLVGDITPMDNVPKSEKARREEAVVEYIATRLLGNVNGGAAGQEIRAIFAEFEKGETAEARFVQDVDKIELILQMFEYERAHGLDLSDFTYVASRIVSAEVKAWAAEILDEREKFWGERAHATYSAEKPPEPHLLEQQLEYYGRE